MPMSAPVWALTKYGVTVPAPLEATKVSQSVGAKKIAAGPVLTALAVPSVIEGVTPVLRVAGRMSLVVCRKT